MKMESVTERSRNNWKVSKHSEIKQHASLKMQRRNRSGSWTH